LNSQSASSQGFPFFRITLCAAALVGLAGCPQGAELENPEDYMIPVASGGTGTAGTGNPTGSGGTGTGGTGTAGTGTAGTGTAGTGTAGTGTGGIDPGCDWQTALTKSCALSVCHGTRAPFGDLNLTPDDGLVARIKDVTATNGDLDCDPSDEYLECTTLPPECSAYGSAKLVDSANPDASFIITKLTASGCGNQMPMPPGDSTSAGWTPDRLTCIQDLVRAIAALP
jgi:hypothetical protein